MTTQHAAAVLWTPVRQFNSTVMISDGGTKARLWGDAPQEWTPKMAAQAFALGYYGEFREHGPTSDFALTVTATNISSGYSATVWISTAAEWIPAVAE